jgi:isoquinoline 1-oxidoreductase beta subunit
MGQQIWTALAQILVEELDVDWDNVQIVQAEGDAKYGSQNTDGSRSIRNNFERFRLMGAAMRVMLEMAAAEYWTVKRSDCVAKGGAVVHKPTGRKLSYGKLAETARNLPIPPADQIIPVPRDEWKTIAKPVKSLMTPSIVRGEGTYGQDVSVPGMKYAVIARPPTLYGKVKRLSDEAALAIPGVEAVVRMPDPKPPARFQPLGGVAVIARDTWAAMKGRDALDIEWEASEHASYNTPDYVAKLREVARSPGDVRRKRGDVAAALKGASKTVLAEYYVPHFIHSCMEPPAVVASWDGEKVTCYGCTQTPQSARNNVSEICGVPLDDVTIKVSWLGGGFGRKSKPDYFAEAAILAREVGSPVKVVWTREDATTHSYYHTVSVQRLEAALDEKGACQALLHRTAFPTISSTFSEGATNPSAGEMRLGASDTPWNVPNIQLESGGLKAHVRIGWLRAVANIQHAFAVQSFACELAHAAGREPLEYLLELIGPPRTIDPNKEGATYDNYGSPLSDYPIDTGRLADVTKRAAKLANWGRDLPDGHGLGIAVHRSFASYVATVVEVAVDSERRLSIPGVWSVIDAGTIVNPNHVKAQMEGGCLFGLSNALYGNITAKDGVIEQKNFPDWRMMRMNEAPRDMVCEIVKSDAPPGGVGEPPTPPAAPALTNAIFAACGARVRDLPVFDASRSDRLPMVDGGSK